METPRWASLSQLGGFCYFIVDVEYFVNCTNEKKDFTDRRNLTIFIERSLSSLRRGAPLAVSARANHGGIQYFLTSERRERGWCWGGKNIINGGFLSPCSPLFPHFFWDCTSNTFTFRHIKHELDFWMKTLSEIKATSSSFLFGLLRHPHPCLHFYSKFVWSIWDWNFHIVLILHSFILRKRSNTPRRWIGKVPTPFVFPWPPSHPQVESRMVMAARAKEEEQEQVWLLLQGSLLPPRLTLRETGSPSLVGLASMSTQKWPKFPFC